MRIALIAVATLVAVSVLQAASPFQTGTVVLIADQATPCGLDGPPPLAYTLSVIPPGSTVSTYPFYTGWFRVVSYSSRAGLIVSYDQITSVFPTSVLSTLQGDGSLTAFGNGVLVDAGLVCGIAPTSTGVFVLANVSDRCGPGPSRLRLLERATRRVLSEIVPPIPGILSLSALATVSEWRAAMPRSGSRRRVAGH